MRTSYRILIGLTLFLLIVGGLMCTSLDAEGGQSGKPIVVQGTIVGGDGYCALYVDCDGWLHKVKTEFHKIPLRAIPCPVKQTGQTP